MTGLKGAQLFQGFRVADRRRRLYALDLAASEKIIDDAGL